MKTEVDKLDTINTSGVNNYDYKKRYWAFKNYNYDQRNYDFGSPISVYVLIKLDQEKNTGKYFHHGILITEKDASLSKKEVKALLPESSEVWSLIRHSNVVRYVKTNNLYEDKIYEFGSEDLFLKTPTNTEESKINNSDKKETKEENTNKKIVVKSKPMSGKNNKTAIVKKESGKQIVKSEPKLLENKNKKEKLSENTKFLECDWEDEYVNVDDKRKNALNKIISRILNNWNFEHFYVYEPQLLEEHKELILELLKDKSRVFVDYGLKRHKGN